MRGYGPAISLQRSHFACPRIGARQQVFALHMAQVSDCASERRAGTWCRCCNPQQPEAAHQPRTHARRASSGGDPCSRSSLLTHLQAVLGVLQVPVRNAGRLNRRRCRGRPAVGQVPWRWLRWLSGLLLCQVHAGRRRRRRPAVGQVP